MVSIFSHMLQSTQCRECVILKTPKDEILAHLMIPVVAVSTSTPRTGGVRPLPGSSELHNISLLQK